MAERALADFLTDFGRGPAPVAGEAAAMPSIAEVLAPPPLDPEAILAAEVAVAEARLRTELQTAAEAALAEQQQRHDAELEALRAELGALAGQRIAAELAAAEERFVALISDATARILSSMLSDDLNRRSVERLADMIRGAVADRDAVRIRVAGPQSLFETLQAALGPLAAQCDFAEAPGFDLTVAIDDALFETRLTEWSATIGEVIS